MGKLTNSMWRLLGSQSTRNQSKSLGVIKDADKHTDWAADLDDEDLSGLEEAMRSVAEWAGILADEVKAGDIVIIRYEGPKGGPGMPEMLTPTSAIRKAPKITEALVMPASKSASLRPRRSTSLTVRPRSTIRSATASGSETERSARPCPAGRSR